MNCDSQKLFLWPSFLQATKNITAEMTASSDPSPFSIQALLGDNGSNSQKQSNVFSNDMKYMCLRADT